eukprot:12909891-Prorocentrum_lima.AAC.1
MGALRAGECDDCDILLVQEHHLLPEQRIGASLAMGKLGWLVDLVPPTSTVKGGTSASVGVL